VDVEEWLHAHPALSAIGPRLSYAHLAGVEKGTWLFQIRPLAGGGGHLVLRPGDGGVGELLGLVEHLRLHVPSVPADELPFLVEPAFGAIASRTIASHRSTTTPPPPLSPAGGQATPVNEVEYLRRASIALHLFAVGRYRESVALWKALARDSADRDKRWRALHQVGVVYEALEDYERAVHFIELALAEGAPLSDVGGDLARARHRLG
jgi:hypothetical protein